MKSNDEIKEAMEEKTDDELKELVEELEEKTEDRHPPISQTMLDRLRRKTIASSVLEDRKEGSSATERRSAPKPRGQQGLEEFS